MDMKKIGVFLRELRKEQGLTQEELGEKLGVTNKTISRWETGVYLPPVECLKLLSEEYGLTINELLCGQRLEEQSYQSAAEQTIASALERSEWSEKQEKQFEKRIIVLMVFNTLLALGIIRLLPDAAQWESVVKEIIVLVLVLLLFTISNALAMVALALRNGVQPEFPVKATSDSGQDEN